MADHETPVVASFDRERAVRPLDPLFDAELALRHALRIDNDYAILRQSPSPDDEELMAFLRAIAAALPDLLAREAERVNLRDEPVLLTTVIDGERAVRALREITEAPVFELNSDDLSALRALASAIPGLLSGETAIRAAIKAASQPNRGFMYIAGRDVYYREVLEAFGLDAARASRSPEKTPP